ncbi:MAG: VCBS repeat-containing protein, partial [Anaerolineales bacterium]|nr:VCBS repeat-containing protein [Anaerolineales bacterium]
MKKQIYFAGTFFVVLSIILVLSDKKSVANNLMASAGTLSFSNQTAAAGVTLIHSTPITSGDGAQMISGGATGDFNNDGWADLYVIGGGDGQADALFINQGSGTFANQT